MQGSSHGLQIFIQFSCTIQLPLDMRWIGIGLSQSLGFYEIQKDQRIASLCGFGQGRMVPDPEVTLEPYNVDRHRV